MPKEKATRPCPLEAGRAQPGKGGTARAAVRPPEAAVCCLPLELFEEDEVPLIFHADEKSFKVSQSGLPNRFYVMWKKACGSIGMPDLCPYDLRRSAIRNLIHAGVPELTETRGLSESTDETRTKKLDEGVSLGKMAPQVGFEPTTLRLTAGCSAVELLRNTAGRTVARTRQLRQREPQY